MTGSAVDAEQAIERIQQKPGVTGFVICGPETPGDDGESHFEIHRVGANMQKDVAQQYADNFSKLTTLARSVIRDLDPQNELLFFRVKAKKQEILVAPNYEPRSDDAKFHIITLQSLPN